MPVLSLQTNVPQDKLGGEAVLKELTELVASELGKPSKFVSVVVEGGKMLSWDGSMEPAVVGSLTSIGAIGGEVNKQVSSRLSKLLVSKWNVSPQRYYLEFKDVQRNDMGYNGKTFAAAQHPAMQRGERSLPVICHATAPAQAAGRRRLIARVRTPPARLQMQLYAGAQAQPAVRLA